MPIDVRCSGCGGRFQAAKKLAGKRVACPRCSVPILVPNLGQEPPPKQRPPERPSPSPLPPQEPEPAPDAWHVLTTDDEPLGPISEAKLRSLLEQGRLDAFCRVRRQGSDEWKWIEDVFPGMVPSAPAEAGDGLPAGSQPRLRACPDCGQMVSRRASQCPHCGCPIAVEDQPPIGVGVRVSDGTPIAKKDAPHGRRKKLLWIGGGSATVVAVLLVAGVWWVWSTLGRAANQAESLLRDLTGEPPPMRSKMPERTASGSFDDWAAEAADAMARQVDEAYRKAHFAASLIGQVREEVDLLESLAGPHPFREEPAKKPDESQSAAAGPYESQYKALYEECLKHVGDDVEPAGADQAAVWDAASRWAEQKQAALEDRLQEQLGL